MAGPNFNQPELRSTKALKVRIRANVRFLDPTLAMDPDPVFRRPGTVRQCRDPGKRLRCQHRRQHIFVRQNPSLERLFRAGIRRIELWAGHGRPHQSTSSRNPLELCLGRRPIYLNMRPKVLGSETGGHEQVRRRWVGPTCGRSIIVAAKRRVFPEPINEVQCCSPFRTVFLGGMLDQTPQTPPRSMNARFGRLVAHKTGCIDSHQNRRPEGKHGSG